VKTLADLLKGKKAVVVLGPGGVGKTTVSAALALASAGAGKNTLAVTVDPSLRLRDALDMKETAGKIEDVTVGKGFLHALLLDTKTEMNRFVSQYVSDPALKQAIVSNIFFQKAAAQSVGTHEYMSMIRLHDTIKSKKYDLVITDTPPAEHAIDFLEAPKRLSRLLSHESFRMASKLMTRSGKGVLHISGMVSRGLSRFVDLSAFNSLLEFVLSFGTLYDALLGISKWFLDFIAGADCAVVVITSASGQRIDDTTRFIRYLKSIGIDVDGVIVNRVYRWKDKPPSGAVRSEVFKDLFSEPELRFSNKKTLNSTVYKITIALQWLREVRQAQEAELNRLAGLFPELPVFVLPALEHDINGPDDLLGLIEQAEIFTRHGKKDEAV